MSIAERIKIDNTTIEVEFEDGTKKKFSIIKINSRSEAIKIATDETKKALKKNSAFEKLDQFTNDFSRYRNYEIEDYLDLITNKFYRINEKCPFNLFSWFD